MFLLNSMCETTLHVPLPSVFALYFFYLLLVHTPTHWHNYFSDFLIYFISNLILRARLSAKAVLIFGLIIAVNDLHVNVIKYMISLQFSLYDIYDIVNL